jgi:hypothetical protein
LRLLSEAEDKGSTESVGVRVDAQFALLLPILHQYKLKVPRDYKNLLVAV